MPTQLFLIHWHPDEIYHIAAQLQAAKWEIIGLEAVDGGEAYKEIKTNQPDSVLLFLTRQPAHGRQLAKALQQTKSTEAIPLIFVGGSETAVSDSRSLFPKAVFTSPEDLLTLLESQRQAVVH